MLETKRVGVISGRTVPSASCPVVPGSAVCRSALTRPWYVRVWDSTILPRFYLSSPKPGLTTGGSGRRARWGSGAESGRTGCQQNCSPRRQASLVPSKASQTRRLNDSTEVRTSETLCKPMEKQNPRLTRGPSPVYPRFINGTKSALSPWLLTSGPTPFCLCKPFLCKACPGIQCDGGTKPAVDPRSIAGLSAGRRPLFVPGC